MDNNISDKHTRNRQSPKADSVRNTVTMFLKNLRMSQLYYSKSVKNQDFNDAEIHKARFDKYTCHTKIELATRIQKFCRNCSLSLIKQVIDKMEDEQIICLQEVMYQGSKHNFWVLSDQRLSPSINSLPSKEIKRNAFINKAPEMKIENLRYDSASFLQVEKNASELVQFINENTRPNDVRAFALTSQLIMILDISLKEDSKYAEKAMTAAERVFGLLESKGFTVTDASSDDKIEGFTQEEIDDYYDELSWLSHERELEEERIRKEWEEQNGKPFVKINRKKT